MQMRIGGKEVSPADERWIPVINPATGEEIDRVPEGTLCEVDDAVSSALAAFDGWAKKTARERGMLLYRAAGLVREQHQELARLLTAEQGKPLRDSVDEIRGYAHVLEFYAGIAAAQQGDCISLGSSGDVLVIREPLGVCGAIIPWNMPALIMGWKLAPALLAGNTLVLKPSSGAPLTCLSLASLLERSGLPGGVLNLVTGKGEVVGEGIVRHPGIKKISFTGDRVTGERVRELAGSSMKEVSLELGGSDPMIVWKDADLGKAVAGALRGRFYNAGQTCTAVKRLYVHCDIVKEFTLRLRQRVDAMNVGNGMDPAVDMGPLSGRAQSTRSSLLWIRWRGRGRAPSFPEGPPYPGLPMGTDSFMPPHWSPTPSRNVCSWSRRCLGRSFRSFPWPISKLPLKRQIPHGMVSGLRSGHGTSPSRMRCFRQ